MIDFYTWGTPNGRKVSILLEELDLPYQVKPIDITAGDQLAPDFLEISPNNRIPAIVDRETGMSLMESGAILLYLAEKEQRFLCAGQERWAMMEWLMWQMGGLGPMLGQVHHFLRFNKGAAPYAEERYSGEAHRLYKVLNKRLSDRDYVAGAGRGEYTIADMAIWPWISRFEWQEVDLKAYPAVCNWYQRLAARPAVQRGYQVPTESGPVPLP
ncbi:putative glutathione-S-transferase-related protein [Roseobacter sp. SK209-2-6]|uniref:glutathione S-transferase family protein n=1 Tax=Roseobacter sp. SK209-2-6 TaxID=388739 RepID=UPI0000F3ED1D|nr:glutathione S-transferase N-terminal domain-containing protein [Roseobacter sp. SK209-2-6]EBA16736.1 putative glutathione-S-transferase-related protein [Roseobacter sp. SK209-2-6]